MEKKYYFRGLGLGIIVTAVIMGIALSGGKKRAMTDEEVIARAKELGMIEDSRLLESSKEEGKAVDSQEEKKAEGTAKKDVTVAADKVETEPIGQTEKEPVVSTPEPEAGNEDVEEEKEEVQREQVSVPEEPERGNPQLNTNEMTQQDEDVARPETDAVTSVTISNGDGSYTVARKLAEAGVVGSAESYDRFLCANGYDKKLRTGTFRIPANASDEQIARIVTGQE